MVDWRTSATARLSVFAVISIGLLISGCSDDLGIIEDCNPRGPLEPVCGIKNPEDMVNLPEPGFVLISEYGRFDGSVPGFLSVYDSSTRTVHRLGPFDEKSPENWGSSDCDSPPGGEFSPHGIDFSIRVDGRLQILAVNHGNGERVEFFELISGGSDLKKYRAIWRGCVEAPEGAALNAVAAIPKERGFVATQTYRRDKPVTKLFIAWNLFTAKFGFASGGVLIWRGNDMTYVPGTTGTFPNGIIVSPDARTFYVNMQGVDKLKHLSLDGGPALASVDMNGTPDNLRWNLDQSRILSATTRESIRVVIKCMDIPSGACPSRAALVEIDPETLETRDLFENRGAPLGGFTVGIELPDSYLLGTYASDRVMHVPKTYISREDIGSDLVPDTSNAEKIGFFFQNVLSEGQLEALPDIVADNYRSHYPNHSGLPAEIVGLKALISVLENTGSIESELKRVISDGAYVYVQALYGGKSGVIGGDIFKFDANRKISDHWLVRQKMYPDTDDQEIVFSGPGISNRPVDDERLSRNKALVKSAFELVWSQGQIELTNEFFAESYIQHNPHIPDGSKRLQKMIEATIVPYIAQRGKNYPVEILHIGAQGDFVFVHLKTVLYNATTGVESNVQSMEIVRINDESKLAEHWDILQIEGVELRDVSTLF